MANLSYAQPKIPKEKIPANISTELKKQIDKLYSRDPTERAMGAHHLGDVRRKADISITFLIEMLEDDVALQWVETDSNQTYLPPEFWTPGELTSPGEEAAKALANIGTTDIIEPLSTYLKDNRWYVRRNAALALGGIKDKRSVEVLIDVLKDQNRDVQSTAISSLVSIGDLTIIPLINAFKSKDDFIRINATEVLTKIDFPFGWNEIPNFWIDILQDKNPEVRRNAVVISGMWPISNLRTLITMLADKEPVVRKEVATILGKTGDRRAIKSLVIACKDKDSAVRLSATHALGKIDDQKAIKILVEMLRDKDSAMQQTAAEALRGITGVDIGRDRPKWIEWCRNNGIFPWPPIWFWPFLIFLILISIAIGIKLEKRE